MLKAVLEADQSTPAIPSIRHLLKIIAVEHGLLPDSLDYFDVFMTSLLPEKNWSPGRKTISFFDNCASRIARQPAHYEDLAAKTKGDRPAMCLLPFCVSEQWPFVIAAEEAKDRENIAGWISRLLMLLTSAGEDENVIQALRNQMVTATNEATICSILRKAGRKGMKKIYTQEQIQGVGHVAARTNSPSPAAASHDLVALETTFERQPKRAESMEGLERLHQEELGEVIANGRLGRLCGSLSSLEDETRRQALITLQSMLRQIEVCCSRL
jgi:nucleolar pre-ribosomal-associated protein 1